MACITLVAHLNLKTVGKKFLVVPADCKQIVLSVAHESPLARHFSHRKTESNVSDQFY